jgi:DNA anti-recombination protein RmuC
MADPATREVERFLVLAACGIEPMTASRRQELAAEIAKLLEDALDLEISSAELASMSDRSMLSVKAALLSSEGGQSVQNQCSRVLSKEEQQARVQRDEAQRSTARLQTQLDQVRRDLEAQPDAQHRLATQLTDELVALLPLEKKIQGLLVQQKLPFRWLRQR